MAWLDRWKKLDLGEVQKFVNSIPDNIEAYQHRGRVLEKKMADIREQKSKTEDADELDRLNNLEAVVAELIAHWLEDGDRFSHTVT